MIMTVLTQDGKFHAATEGDVRSPDTSGKPADLGSWRAGLMAAPGQTLRVIEVPDKFRSLLADPDAFVAELTALLRQRGLL